MSTSFCGNRFNGFALVLVLFVLLTIIGCECDNC
jgi:uncharacterized protein (TIGR01732 family)